MGNNIFGNNDFTVDAAFPGICVAVTGAGAVAGVSAGAGAGAGAVAGASFP